MTFWLTLAGMVAVTFGSRYAGLALQADLPPFWVRCLHFVPIAVFAALVTPSLEGRPRRGGDSHGRGRGDGTARVAHEESRDCDRDRDGRVLAAPDPVLSRPVSRRSTSVSVRARSLRDRSR